MSRHCDSGLPPLIVHVVHRLDVGGLENGVINLINHMSPTRYRHAIVCLTGYGAFHERLRRSDVTLIALGKRDGKDVGHYLRLWRALRRLRPAIVHTRNLGTLEAQLLAALAGVRWRVHGEHGREADDLDGSNRRHRLLRRLLRPVAGHYIAVSLQLAQWLRSDIEVPPWRVQHIGNGVDCHRFEPAPVRTPLPAPPGFADGQNQIIGSVGRMAAVKDYETLIHAFITLVRGQAAQPALPAGAAADSCTGLRLVIIGAGPTRARCIAQLQAAGVAHLAWLPGARDDVADLLRGFDVFVLPSLAEGMSNTVLEAMASGLPVVATAVGGNLEVVQHGLTGTLVAPRAPAALAAALAAYLRDPALRAQHGRQARDHVVRHHSLQAMVTAYQAVYDRHAQSSP